MNRLECLSRFDFFHRLPESVRLEMEEDAKVVQLDAGTVFYRQGGDCPHVAFVGSGDLRVFRLSETGREITLYHVGDKDTCLVNVLCAFLDTASPATAVTETPVEATIVTAGRFRRWVRENPAMLEYVFGRVSQRVVDLMVLVEEVAFQRLDQRLAELLLRRSSSGEGLDGEVSATHERLALELGAAREVVSRLLKAFEQCGAVELGRGRLKVTDTGRLGSIAGTDGRDFLR